MFFVFLLNQSCSIYMRKTHSVCRYNCKNENELKISTPRIPSLRNNKKTKIKNINRNKKKKKWKMFISKHVYEVCVWKFSIQKYQNHWVAITKEREDKKTTLILDKLIFNAATFSHVRKMQLTRTFFIFSRFLSTSIEKQLNEDEGIEKYILK